MVNWGVGPMEKAALALVLTVLLGMTACGGGGSGSSAPVTSAAPPKQTLSHQNIFDAVPLPLSPDTVGIGNSPAQLAAAQQKAEHLANATQKEASVSTTDPPSASTQPYINQWLFLVNGSSLVFNGSSATATLASGLNAPLVLTVNGPAPAGAPSPNGATGVSIEQLGSADAKAQFWKAIQITGESGEHLRSGESFQVNTNNNTNSTMPSALVGWGVGTGGVPLDLGYNSYPTSGGTLQGAQTGIFWDQSGATNQSGNIVDNSKFEQWTYDTQTKQITNVNSNLQLTYDPNSQTVVAEEASYTDSNSQWYPYPDYFLNRIVQQTPCNPPFPDWTGGGTGGSGGDDCAIASPADDEAGATAAYNYFSQYVLGPGVNPSCTYGTTYYTGIRCEYLNLSQTSGTLTSCQSNASNPSAVEAAYNNSNPSVPVSAGDWKAVTSQLYLECLYASEVQTLFANYDTILNTVAAAAQGNLLALAEDVSLPPTTTTSFSWGTFIEGLVYTFLNVAAAVASGGATAEIKGFRKAVAYGAPVVANLMETGVNTGLSSGSSTQNQQKPLTGTIAEISGQIAAQLTTLTDESANGEDIILTDWGKLQAVGPRTETDGYNGLGLSAADVPFLVQAMENNVNQQMLAVMMSTNYAMALNVARNSTTPAFSFVNWSNEANLGWNYSTFGSDLGSYTVGAFTEPDRSGVPQQAALDDLKNYGEDPFEFINGINRWQGEQLVTDNMGCINTVATIFNASSRGFSVTVTPQAGVLAVPGTDFTPTNGSESPSSFELRPFGYLPIYTSDNYDARTGADSNLTMNVSINETFSPDNTAATFSFGSGGCYGNEPAVFTANPVANYNYFIAGTGTNGQRGNSSSGYGGTTTGGVWLKLGWYDDPVLYP